MDNREKLARHLYGKDCVEILEIRPVWEREDSAIQGDYLTRAAEIIALLGESPSPAKPEKSLPEAINEGVTAYLGRPPKPEGKEA